MIDPSIALNLKTPPAPESPLQMYGQVMNLRALGQQQQLQQQQLQAATLENQQRQLSLDDQTKMREAWTEANGDGDKLFTLATQKGVSPGALMSLQSAVLEQKTKRASLSKEEAANTLNLATRLQSRLAPIAAEADPAKQAALWNQGVTAAVQAGEMTPADAQQHPYPGADGVKRYVAGLNWEKWTLSQQQQATAAQRQTEAANATTKLNAELPGITANSDAAQLRNFAAQLAGARDQGSYAAALGNVPKKYADQFPAQYDRAGILKVGMTPDQVTTTEQAATNAQEAQRHNRTDERISQQNANANSARATIEGKRFATDQAGIETLAQDLAHGGMTRLRDVTSLRGDQRLQVYNRVKQINPSYDFSDLDRRLKMEDWITNGKGGENLQSFGTFLEHAGAASDAVNGIRNTSVSYINKPLNWWRANMAGSPEYTALVGSLEPVRQEAENFLKNGHAQHSQDIEAAHTILNENASPAQIQAALKAMGHTAQARFTEMNFRYRKEAGHDIQDPFSPEALAGAAKIGVNVASPSPSAAGAPKPSAGAAFPNGGGKPLTDPAIAQQFLSAAGGNKAIARQLAAKSNWKF